ncbi:hypothetical protein [Maribacter sp. MAR_2009_72]|uniref:hypothetical protein n=1 Tax=Maribacter sp. MAR_2009_72 TaxID=1250050 RepID=UPI00119A8167|nr:hypothetical protein [Maribacter sp. MAR_2009_72]TVZ16413.1 hypothetical protein JM81_2673 [Maribacter sp. MAR_2009_72]
MKRLKLLFTNSYFLTISKSILFILLMNNAIYGQSVGINTLTPDPAAALDIQSTTGGLLIPRMTTAQIDALASPPDGLMIYNTDLQNSVMFVQGSAFELYNSTATNTMAILSGLEPALWLNVDFLNASELLGLTVHRFRMDLTNSRQIRVIANVTGLTLGAGSGLTLSLEYSTDGSTWAPLNASNFGPGLSITVNGLLTTPWVDIDAGAQDDVQLRLVGQANGGIVTQVGLGLVQVEVK